MAEDWLPLLLFPKPTLAARTRRAAARILPRAWGRQEQAAKIGPQLAQLQKDMLARKIRLQGNAFGLVPEVVLVLESTPQWMRLPKPFASSKGLNGWVISLAKLPMSMQPFCGT